MNGPSRREWIIGVLAAALLAAAAAYFAFRPDGYFPMVEARLEPENGPRSGALDAPAGSDREPAGSEGGASEETANPGSPIDASAPADGLPGAETGPDPSTESPELGFSGGGLPGLPASGAGMGAATGGAERSGSLSANGTAGKGADPAAGSQRKLSPIRHVSAHASRDARAAEESDPTIANIGRILAAAGVLQGPGGTSPFLQSALRGGKGSLLFDPNRVAAAGGRSGQGPMSMEKNSVVTPENFDLSAKGLGASKGKEPPGPKIPAGKAPALPSAHLAYILQAARQTGVDPALIAATAARESNFRYGAYRAEPHLKSVLWREAPGQPAQKYFDGSVGPMQVLRSNFLSRGIDNDADANNLANNYRIGAQIIRGDMNAFPNNAWKSVAAYNVGVYGAKIGRVPANNYTDTILTWRKDYEKAIAPYR